ncbi:MAG TPA: lipoyl(octanoyl) transferase LipB [Acidobacteriota bacterium]
MQTLAPRSGPAEAEGPVRPRRPPVEVAHARGLSYRAGLERMEQAVDRAKAGGIETLLLFEHPPVLTLGRAADRGHVLAAPELLEGLGIEVVATGRGGDVTYHGPGQLVGYPVLSLSPDRRDVYRYVRDLEEVLLRTLSDFGIGGARVARRTGIWVRRAGAGPERKIAAIGVRISRWVSSHGFALNLDPDLAHFNWIVPCGIADAGVTSMREQLGQAPAWPAVERSVVRHLAEVFEREIAA